MPTVIPERVSKAIEHLSPRPGERLLEIGCGRGVAAQLVCGLIRDGTLVAIDRSSAAVDATRALCASHIGAGRLTVEQVSLSEISSAPGSIDRAFAINVNLFWMKPGAELAKLRETLVPGGSLRLYFEPPSAAKGIEIEARLNETLPAAGWAIGEVAQLPLARGGLLAVVATPLE